MAQAQTPSWINGVVDECEKALHEATAKRDALEKKVRTEFGAWNLSAWVPFVIFVLGFSEDNLFFERKRNFRAEKMINFVVSVCEKSLTRQWLNATP